MGAINTVLPNCTSLAFGGSELSEDRLDYVV